MRVQGGLGARGYPLSGTNSRYREIAYVMVVVALIAAAAALPLLRDPYTYYRDDNVAYFMPMILEIADQLKHGHAPFITDRIWYGGAILAEYQYAVLNPVNLLVYVVMSGFGNLALAAAFFAVLHYGLYACGIVLLCRTLGLGKTGAAAAATTACSSAWLFYWAAPSWITGLSSIAWMPWGVFALCQVYRHRSWLLPAGLLTAAPVLSGYPFTTFTWTLVLGVAALALLRYGEDRLGTWRVVAAIASGALVALPALLPLMLYMQDTARASDPSTVTQWRASLDGLIAVGLPSFVAGWPTRSGIAFVPGPFYYACWFAPLAIVGWNWRDLGDWRLRAFLAMTLVFAALAILPGVGWFRWPMRYLAYFHLGLGLSVGWLISFDRGTWHDGRPLPIGRIALCLGIPVTVAMLNAPSFAGLHLAMGAAIACLVLLLTLARGNLHLRNVILFGGQAAFLAAMLTMFPRNVAVPDLRPPLQRPDLALAMNAGNLLSLRQIDAGARPDPDFWSETAYGNRGIFLARRTINGYTPTLLKDLAAALCFDYTSAACPEASDKLFEQDRLTGLPLIDLLRVDRVTADAAHRESFARLAEGTWRATATHQAQSIFERVKDLSAQPGSVTWSDGAAKLVLVERTPAEELYEIAVGSKDARVLFARASYQGFSAELDGRPLALTAHRGILPLVTIPADNSGILALRYTPPGLEPGLLAAAAGIVLLLILGFVPAPGARRAAGPSPSEMQG